MASPSLTLLLIEDNPGDARLLQHIFTAAPTARAEIIHVDRLARGIERLSAHSFDAILLDLSLPDSTGLDTLKQMRAHAPNLPIVVLTGQDDDAIAVEAVRLGAQDYLVKGHLESDTITRAIRYAIERKRAEEKIRQLNAELEQRVVERTAQLAAANQELEAFTYSVAHDLRTPLRAIDGYTRILLEDYPAAFDDEGKRMGRIVRAETQRMGKLIDNLLALSRMNSTAMRIAPIDMQALVQSIFNRLTTPEARARIDFRLDALPVAAGDADLIQSVWENLLANALKFSSKRERAVIAVSGTATADQVTYAVRDNGAGFDMQYAKKLFGVFQRLHSDKEFEGTGVGLAIVQRAIQRHGGRVWGESQVDAGATFSFTLPIPREAHSELP